MSVVDDAAAAYSAWKETPSGSYLERTLADSIVRDLVPALIHAASRRPMPIGFGGDIAELGTDTELAVDDDESSWDDDQEGRGRA